MRHITQKGTIVVAAGGADSATVQVSGSLVFSPDSVTIRPGGSVRWINLSDANHALQTDRACVTTRGVIVHRTAKDLAGNQDTRVHYPVGRYQYLDREVNNGFVYFYSVTAFDSTTDQSVTSQLGGLRSAFESEGVIPQAGVDVHGKHGVWVVPNPYRGYASAARRPSAWDLTPSASDPTGTHVDFMGLPPGRWTVRVYTVAGDLVKEIHSEDAVNESVRRSVSAANTAYPGFNRQQDNANDGQARWNLISRNGQDVASGIYLFTVESAEGSQRGKFVIIR
jgi:plastocyanin